MIDRQALGHTGEERARVFLKKNGYRILESNYRTDYGEIDCIARDRKELVFIEVKLRTTHAFGHPFEAVTAVKQKRIVRSALHYVKERRLGRENLRFDVVSIDPEGTIELIKAAFPAPAGYMY